MKPQWKQSTNLVAGLIVAGLLWGCGPARVVQESLPEVPASDGDTPATTTVDDRLLEAFREAVMLMKAKRFSEAAQQLQAIAREDPTVPGVQLNLGIAYLQLDEYQQAEQALRRALQLDGGKSIAYNQLGILFRKRGQFRQARDAYQQALELKPDYPLAHLNLGILCDLYLQNRGCALRHYRAYQRLSAATDLPVDLWIEDLQRQGSDQSRAEVLP